MARHLQSLETRRLMVVHFAIDGAADVHAISPYIYGVNQPLAGVTPTLYRAGGNRWTAYNWETNASNAGSDYLYQNDDYLGGGNTPGGAVAPMLTTAASQNAASLITIPMAGYVSADKLGGGDVRNSGANYLSTRFNQAQPRKGAAFSLTPNLTDDFAYADEYVNYLKATYPASQTDPNKPIWFSLDNEPDLWSSTHAEIHPNAVTYAELIQKTIDYAKAIKDVSPGTNIFGPASYGFYGYVALQGAPDAAGRDFLNTYLDQLKAASVADGRRLLDTLDLHWYPEATGGGVRITGSDTSAAVVAARLQAPRSLWDPTYTESSWITNDYLHAPINLINRVKGQIAAHYAGTNLAFTEYNYGGGGHISGGIAQADVLGIFGREGVFAANQWSLNGAEPFVGGAFRMYRNFDGAGSNFGSTSIRATNDDVAGASVYASVDASNPTKLTIVAINKTNAALPAEMSFANLNVAANGNVYRLTSANSTPQNAGAIAIAGNALSYSMPAYSVSTISIPIRPVALNSSFDWTTSPNTVSVQFNQNVAASLAPSDLVVTTGTTSFNATSVAYDSATNRATFTLPTAMADGRYVATLAAGAVSNTAGATLAADVSTPFFVLAGDVNHSAAVDFDDLLIVAQNYGQTGRSFGQGNVNYSGDGAVDFDDLLLLAQHYGQSVLLSPTITPTHAPMKRNPVAAGVLR